MVIIGKHWIRNSAILAQWPCDQRVSSPRRKWSPPIQHPNEPQDCSFTINGEATSSILPLDSSPQEGAKPGFHTWEERSFQLYLAGCPQQAWRGLWVLTQATALFRRILPISVIAASKFHWVTTVPGVFWLGSQVRPTECRDNRL
jgi:hypothetical protein